MTKRHVLASALMMVLLAGCGSGGGDVVTDPSKLTPLTEEQVAEIKSQDEAISEEEGQSYDFRKKADKAK